MKSINWFYFVLLIGLFATATSCQKEEVNPETTEIAETTEALATPKEVDDTLTPLNVTKVISLDSIIENSTNEVTPRSGKQLIYTATKTISQGGWLSFVQANKSLLSQYKYYVKVTPSWGDPDVMAYRRSSNGSWFPLRKSENGGTSIDETYIQDSDLNNNVDKAYLFVYGYYASSFTVQIFREAVGGGGNSNNNFTITPYNPSPSSGTVNQTNFFFRANVSGGTSGGSGIIDFKAPDNSIYPFSMNKASTYFYKYKTLSQVGTYQVRYRITKNGQTQTSNWMNLTVSGCNNLDIPFSKQPYGTAKCTQYCVKMIAANLGYDYTEQQICDSGFNGNCSWSNNSQAATAISNLTNKTGYLKTNTSDAFLQNELCNGQPVLVAVKLYMNPNHSVSHQMVLVGMDADYVYVNDPWRSNGKTYQYSRADFNDCFNDEGSVYAKRVITYYR